MPSRILGFSYQAKSILAPTWTLVMKTGPRRTLIDSGLSPHRRVAITTSSNGVARLIAGRVINGTDNGATVVLLWQSEITPKSFSILSSCLIQYGCSFQSSNAIYLAGAPVLPVDPECSPNRVRLWLLESPRWLVVQDRGLGRVHADGTSTIRKSWSRSKRRSSGKNRSRSLLTSLFLPSGMANRTHVGISAPILATGHRHRLDPLLCAFSFPSSRPALRDQGLAAFVINGVLLNVVT